MDVPSLAALLLCLFTAALVAARPSFRGSEAWIAGGFLAGVLVASWFAPGSAFVSVLAGGLIAAALLRSLRADWLLGMSGLIAGVGVADTLPGSLGPAAWLVWLICLLLVIASSRFATARREFAPATLIDQGGCALLIAAPVIAALPAAQSGWKSALALAGPNDVTTGTSTGGWWLALPLIALLIGALRQWWYRR
jgi:hypothetical protein